MDLTCDLPYDLLQIINGIELHVISHEPVILFVKYILRAVYHDLVHIPVFNEGIQNAIPSSHLVVDLFYHLLCFHMAQRITARASEEVCYYHSFHLVFSEIFS